MLLPASRWKVASLRRSDDPLMGRVQGTVMKSYHSIGLWWLTLSINLKLQQMTSQSQKALHSLSFDQHPDLLIPHLEPWRSCPLFSHAF